MALGTKPTYDLAPYLQILHTDQTQLTIDQVSSSKCNLKFKPLGGPGLMSPSSDLQVYWLRFTVAAPPNSATWLIATDYVYLAKIDFYKPGSNGWEVIKTGIELPYATRELTNRCFIFTLPNRDNKPFTCYIRLETKGFYPLHFSAWSLTAFINHTAKEDYLFAICYGVLISMILFNIFLATSLRDRVYLYYVGYISFALVSLVFLNGHATALWDIGLQTYVTFLWGSMGLMTSFAYLFMRNILNTKTLSPLLDKLLLFGFCYGLTIVATGMFNWPWMGRWLTLGSGLFSPWLALAAGIISLRRGTTAARYFLLAWGILALSVAIFVVQEIGPLQGEYWAKNSLLIGTALESILLSLALAARIRELKMERRALAASESRFKQLSYTDGLTGLYNKRYFTMHLERALQEGSISNCPPCLVFLDLDDFKSFNDTYGHDQGDLVIKGLAEIIIDNVRSSDMPCRWGGEEFAIIFPMVDLNTASAIAERICAKFAKCVFAPAGLEVRQTVSLGLAQGQPGDTSADIIRRADQALYQAKKAGKNRLTISS